MLKPMYDDCSKTIYFAVVITYLPIEIFVQFSTDNITVNEGDGMVEIMLQSGLSDVPYSVVVTPSTGSAIGKL